MGVLVEYHSRITFCGCFVCENHSQIIFIYMVNAVLRSKVSYMDMAYKYKNDNVYVSKQFIPFGYLMPFAFPLS